MNTNNPELYSRYSLIQRHLATIPWRLLTLYCDKLPPFRNVLDLGCGTGDITRNLVAFLASLQRNEPQLVVGMDLSPEMIEFCQAKQSELLRSQAKNCFTTDYVASVGTSYNFCVANFDQPFGEDWKASFDLITSHSALHYSHNLHVVFQNMHLALRSGGQFLVMFAVELAEHFLLAGCQIAKKWNSFVPENIMENFTPVTHQLKDNPLKKIQDIVSTAGLKIHTCRFERECYVFSDLIELRGVLEPLYPHIRHVPVELKEKLMDDLVEEYGNRCFWVVEDGIKKATWETEFLVIYGEKP